jgi:hypothetical protein
MVTNGLPKIKFSLESISNHKPVTQTSALLSLLIPYISDFSIITLQSALYCVQKRKCVQTLS